ncbi:MAG: GNAT family N-acetyltransferase [Pyrinomonadaceae bacterium]
MRTARVSVNASARALVPYPVHRERLPEIEITRGKYTLRFAHTPAELDAALRLRFEVFNLELQEGLESSYLTGRDMDEFDLTCHHLIVTDKANGEIVGTYRLRTAEMAEQGGGFYSAGEFDLSSLAPALLGSSVEIGRACIARAHRNTQVLLLLWQGLAAYVAHNRTRYFFGCCSLTSQDAREGMRVLNHLQRQGHLHPSLYVSPQPGLECAPEGYFIVDGKEVHVPRLFQTYLRFGAKVCGPPAIDRQFKTIDFFVIFDVGEMSDMTRRLFFDASGSGAR